MRKQHNRLGYFTKPFISYFIDGNRQAHINHCAKYNVEAINDEGISCRPQSVVYTSEKEFKILQSYKFTSKKSPLIGVAFKYHIQSRHRKIAE